MVTASETQAPQRKRRSRSKAASANQAEAALATNALATLMRSRMALSAYLGRSHGGTRDLYEQFGYNRELQVGDLYATYERSEIGSRIIRAFPQATWREVPKVRDDAGDSAEKLGRKGRANPKYSAFTDKFEEIADRFNIFGVLERLDRLASIGRFGILVMGFAGPEGMDKPLGTGKKELLYLRPYSEANVTISQWERDPTNPRFGLPSEYRIQNLTDGGPAGPVQAMTVHHSRVLHIAEFLDSDEIYGQPRLKAIFNRLQDLDKVIGGSAETFWLTANRGLMLSADKDAKFSDDAKKALKEQAEDYANKLRRVLVGQGFTAQPLGSDTPDPEPNTDKLLDLIAGGAGIPKRILIGAEAGQLASSQDETNWSSRIEERRKSFAGPSIMRPLVQRLIDTENLPKPQGRFYCEWAKHPTTDPVQQAAIASSKSAAIASYSNSISAPMVVPVQEFRRDILGLEPESEFQVEGVDEEPIDETDPNLTDDPEPVTEDPEAEDDEAEPTEDDGKKVAPETNSSAPRSLYVSRRVLNVGALKKWAKDQGFTSLSDNLHVTVVYSRKPIDWMTIPQDYPTGPEYDGSLMIPAGGPRVVEEIGPGRYEVVDGVLTKVGQAVALLFTNADLSWRHQRIIECGAEHGYADYQPHITLTYDAGGLDLGKVEPYQGAIALGPEIFEEIED